MLETQSIASVEAERHSSIRYLLALFGVTAVAIGCFFVWGFSGKDHFAAIPLGNDATWYENYFDATRREIQDRDIFYQNIGHSIENARKADIIILGHSMVLFGLRDNLVREFERRHHLKIFNMASAGDASGEFLRRVIERWHLRPKLWIINADDHAADFFSVSIDNFDNFGNNGLSSAERVLNYSRLKGWLNVAGRNIRWRIEALLGSFAPRALTDALNPFFSRRVSTWRSAVTGNVDYEDFSSYTTPNKKISVQRNPDCHATPSEIADAKRYIDFIGGEIVLTLFPHTDQCPLRVWEIAQQLKLDTILTKNFAQLAIERHSIMQQLPLDDKHLCPVYFLLVDIVLSSIFNIGVLLRSNNPKFWNGKYIG